MKTIQKSILVAVLGVLVIGAALFALPTSTVAAQSPTPPAAQPQATPAQPDKAAARIARLEKAFQIEQKTLERQSNWGDRADKVITRVQTFIAKLKAKGIDPAKLEKALANFQVKLADARAFHASAVGILSTHAGFDANGKVTDVAQAMATVKSAHQILSDARGAMSGTIRNLLEALRDMRSSLKPATQNQ